MTRAFAAIGLCISLGVATYLFHLLRDHYRQQQTTAQKVPGHRLDILEFKGDFLDGWPSELREHYNSSLEKQKLAKTEAEKAAATSERRELQAQAEVAEKAFIERASLSKEVIDDLVTRFASKITHQPIHDLLAECRERQRFIEQTGNTRSDFFFPFAFDPSWMGRQVGSHAYAIYIMRRETPYVFVNPDTPQALGIMTLQGYTPVPAAEAADNDVVLYFQHYPRGHLDGGRASDHYIEPLLWGIVRNGGVTSMQGANGIAHHSFQAGANPGCYYLVFRKEFNPNAPIYDAWRQGDWYDTEWGIVRESMAYSGLYESGSEKSGVSSSAFSYSVRVALFCFVVSLVLIGGDYIALIMFMGSALKPYSSVIFGLLLFATVWSVVNAIERMERRNYALNLGIPFPVSGQPLAGSPPVTLAPETQSALDRATRAAEDSSLSFTEREAANEELNRLTQALEDEFRNRPAVDIPTDKTRELVEKFSKEVYHEPVHDLIDECGGIHIEGGMRRFMIATGNMNSEFFYPVRYDSSWMGAFPCYWYALNICRREPIHFYPHTSKALGMMLAQGYEPISAEDAADDDVVFYFVYSPDGDLGKKGAYRGGATDRLIEAQHWGVMRGGRVASKQLFGGLASHTLNAGGSPGSRYILFRKPFDRNAPVPALENVTDWYETKWCIARKANSYRVYNIPRNPDRSYGPWLGGLAFILLLLRRSANNRWRKNPPTT